MNANQRDARWKEAYELQRQAFEAKKSRKEKSLKDQITKTEQKIRELEEQRHKLEDTLRQTAQEHFRDYESFQKGIIQQSTSSHTSSDSESAAETKAST